MITGKIKSQIDAIWMSFWTGGITNSIDVLEQMTYLFFMKMLDDAQLNKEVVREKVVYDAPRDIFARIEALEAQFAAKQQEFKEKYLQE